jgi:hypothetical protein
MDFPHLHLLLNHFPIIGAMVGVGLFLISFLVRAEDARRSSLIVFVVMALLTIPAFMTGVGAQDVFAWRDLAQTEFAFVVGLRHVHGRQTAAAEHIPVREGRDCGGWVWFAILIEDVAGEGAMPHETEIRLLEFLARTKSD